MTACSASRNIILLEGDNIKQLLGFFSVERNLGKTEAASGTFYQARPDQGLRVEDPEKKETGRGTREMVA